MIVIKTDTEIDEMRAAGHFAWELLELMETYIKPGISTDDINSIIHEKTRQRGAISAPLNYKGFPKSVCTSVNEVVCHGIPNKKKILQEGDIINVDVTPIINGYHGDSSRTFCVGKISKQAQRLIDCTKKCLDLGIAAVKDGAYVGDIGHAVQNHAESNGYSVVRELVGHGIGESLHEEPQIPNYGIPNQGYKLHAGMCIAIEPMINLGGKEIYTDKDGWTILTADGKPSAHFEHTIAILEDGPQILSMVGKNG